MKTAYVVGLLFHLSSAQVVLIKKSKPKWQAGLLNGVGGKIIGDERPVSAMVREFQEETGADTSESGWREFCQMDGREFRLHCFVAKDSAAFINAQTVEAEEIVKIHVDQIVRSAAVSNLPWLIEMALDENYGRPFFSRVEYP